MNDYKYAAEVTTNVHEELIRWASRLLHDAGLEVIDVWGRFPPEGTVRSHLVLFPYRVGPEPVMIDNAQGASLMGTIDNARRRGVPSSWDRIGNLISAGVQRLYPDAGDMNDRKWASASPYPCIDDLPDPIRDWYKIADAAQPKAGWVIRLDGNERGRPPSILWRPGITITAHYIAVTGDPGRGTTERTSDTAPLSLATLSVLATAIQMERGIKVKMPPIPMPDILRSFIPALADALEELGGTREELAAEIRDHYEKLINPEVINIDVMPLHDLSNQEFALLTQALQRPLQAVLNMRVRFKFGAGPMFEPTAAVKMAYQRESNPPGSKRSRIR
ncbi:MAG: hypothetical protein ACJAZO_000186 [Myxococcota bacterium]